MELHNYGHNKVPTIYEAFLGLCWGWLDYESNQELWWHKWHFLASRLTYLALKLHIHTLRLPKIRLKSNAFTRVGFLLSSFCNNQFAPGSLFKSCWKKHLFHLLSFFEYFVYEVIQGQLLGLFHYCKLNPTLTWTGLTYWLV